MYIVYADSDLKKNEKLWTTLWSIGQPEILLNASRDPTNPMWGFSGFLGCVK